MRSVFQILGTASAIRKHLKQGSRAGIWKEIAFLAFFDQQCVLIYDAPLLS